jgi:squalene-hopene/tetraprenyl-beta-curcumene cyclase
LKALSYLQKHQRKNGSWSALWFGNQHTPNHENPVYGTARILSYLHDALHVLKANNKLFQKVQSMIASGEGFLVDAQNSNGSWGGDKNIPGTIEETSLAISALQKNEFGALREHGFVWLDHYLETHGLIPSPIGLYFASLWYDEKMYPLTAYLEALRRYH